MINNNARISIRRLMDSERLEARDRARANIVKRIGNPPTIEQFRRASISKYPAWLQFAIFSMAVIALLAAFNLSATNLNQIGQETVSHTITHKASVVMGGVSVVLLAEISQVIFSLALAMIDHSRSSRYILFGGMAAATIIALTGNIQLTAPVNAFDWLLAVLPPLLVLGVAYVVKEQALHAIRTRHECNRLFQEALNEYKAATSEPENSPYWKASYANALRETLQMANSKGRGRNERIAAMNELTSDDWRYLVLQELQADEWFTEMPQNSTQSVLSNGNGHHEAPIEVVQSVPFGANQNSNGSHQN